MIAHNYSLRSRLNSPNISVKTPISSPATRNGTRSPRKTSCYPSILQLKHIIGSTVSSPNGLSTCELSNSFAYCAGSVAVLATIDAGGTIAYRYFKARPTVTPLNSSSYFDGASATNTPTRKRAIFTSRKGRDDSQSIGSGREWLEDSNGLTWTARERIKAATCVSLSPDGKLLAVGETGYNPRVLLFSTATASCAEQPLSIISEHTIGVRSVAFSADSKYLATLGDVNDGFLNIWTVNSKTGDVRLHSTNKCTTNICDMTWCGTNVVTVGTRHIKIWQVGTSQRFSPQKRARLRLDGEITPSLSPMPLQGRNCLLGKMVDATFTAVTAVSANTAVVCADDGYICRLDLSQGLSNLCPIDNADAPIAAISFRKSAHRVVWAGGGHSIQEHDIEQWTHTDDAPSPADDKDDSVPRKRLSRHSILRESLGLRQPTRAIVTALGCLNDSIVSIDANGGVKIVHLDDKVKATDAHRLSSHSDIVKGIRALPDDAELGSFFTWARNGEIRFWSVDGDLLRTQVCELDQATDDNEPGTNELMVVHYVSQQRAFMTGDRYGVSRIFDQCSWLASLETRGHSAEITDIATHQDTYLLATSGRDRMVQLFRFKEKSLDLVQTMDEHISAVQHICFSNEGQRLLSCSTDRTIIVRERMERTCDDERIMAYLSTRVITLKSSPLSMALRQQEQDVLVVSTMDRHVVKVDVSTGGTLESFKVGDKDSEDTSILNSISLSTVHDLEEQAMVVGFSSIDKSIRAYDLRSGDLLGRESGHTEGISDLILIETRTSGTFPVTQRTVVSTGLDSTIMIWSVSPPNQPLLTPLQELQNVPSPSYDSDVTPTKTNSTTLPPLRKILSKMDISEFMRQNSPSRDPSPHRLRRKASRLALSTSIEEAAENKSTPISRARSSERKSLLEKRSPSPPPQVMRPKKQRSRTEIGRDLDSKRGDWLQRSPSPPLLPVSTPNTPKYQRANNSRLRRPPSVPSDLRMQTVVQQRRQSMSSTSDFGGLNMATEQTCRMLKTYRKKLQAGRGDLDLDEIERELETVLKIVRQRKSIPSIGTVSAATRTNIHVEQQVNALSTLLEKTVV